MSHIRQTTGIIPHRRRPCACSASPWWWWRKITVAKAEFEQRGRKSFSFTASRRQPGPMVRMPRAGTLASDVSTIVLCFRPRIRMESISRVLHLIFINKPIFVQPPHWQSNTKKNVSGVEDMVLIPKIRFAVGCPNDIMRRRLYTFIVVVVLINTAKHRCRVPTTQCPHNAAKKPSARTSASASWTISSIHTLGPC